MTPGDDSDHAARALADRAVLKLARQPSHLRADIRELALYERLVACSVWRDQPAHHLDVALANGTHPRLKCLARSRCVLWRGLLLVA